MLGWQGSTLSASPSCTPHRIGHGLPSRRADPAARARSRGRRRRGARERARWIALLTGLSAGCAEAPAPGRCPSTDDPVITLANRQGSRPFRDGDQVEVFPPPQGGVFTELDVGIVGVPLEDLEQLHVTLDSTGSLGVLATVSYLGSAMPMWCTDDDVLQIDDLPVGLDERFAMTDLPDLHGVAAVLEAVVETRSGEVVVQYDVVLQWTEF